MAKVDFRGASDVFSRVLAALAGSVGDSHPLFLGAKSALASSPLKHGSFPEAAGLLAEAAKPAIGSRGPIAPFLSKT
jgi:hypothetical protein